MTIEYLPFALPGIGEDEIAEVVDSLKSGWITTGPKVRRFEREFAEFIGEGVEAISVNSATAGLHLALEAVGVGPGDRVITTTYTFTATAEVVRYLGADPLLVDIDPHTRNLDIARVEEALSHDPRVKAIIPVHFAGQSCDMDAITKLADRYGIPVIEDAAHALPATWNGRMIGQISTATVFSFYATKTITTGEGGMLVSRSPDLLERARVMRLHGISKDVFNRYSSTAPSWYYEVVAPGYKYNMPDIAAAMGIHQLRKAHAFRNRRHEIARRYDEGLAGLPLARPTAVHPENLHSWHLYVIGLELKKLCIDRDRFIELMAGKGIGTSVHFIPLHLHPYWRDQYGFRLGDFPHAEALYERAVSLPIYTRMTDDDVERVIASVQEILSENLL